MSTVAGVIEVERRIDARPETVFAYFIDPERFTLWFGVEAELDPRPGGTFRVTVTGRSRFVARGRFIEIDPPRRLVYSWGWEPVDGVHEGLTEVPAESTRVEVILEEEGSCTVLKLRHSGLPTRAACEFHTAGWDLTLGRLAIVAAGRDPGPDVLADV